MCYFKKKRHAQKKKEPATLLAEPLPDSGDDHRLSLGVVLTNPVPPVVGLGFAQIHVAPLHLTVLHRAPAAPLGGGGRPLPPASVGPHDIVLDFFLFSGTNRREKERERENFERKGGEGYNK
ncbi:transcription initiation factor TFIID subunit 1 [Striga asiatica]|uniref:Transcription initiation factor TFIID subunit 1 n=1 Tax=Striga asiatica TaxID=4170 RepID=A0A5A7RAI4_STRAF|nr:transcription initiation factor TFIID subunit 1 [Striga asiatica]